VGDGRDPAASSTPSASQASDSEVGTKASRYKIMTVKRGFSQEGDEILDYLVSCFLNESHSIILSD
jgi:hypothetical protein